MFRPRNSATGALGAPNQPYAFTTCFTRGHNCKAPFGAIGFTLSRLFFLLNLREKKSAFFFFNLREKNKTGKSTPFSPLKIRNTLKNISVTHFFYPPNPPPKSFIFKRKEEQKIGKPVTSDFVPKNCPKTFFFTKLNEYFCYSICGTPCLTL